MPYFAADLGTWENGATEKFQAYNRDAAVKVAFLLLEDYPGKDVIAVREMDESGKIIDSFYDYINGRTDR